MADKFQYTYRIPSARWQAWDYSSEGLYFITINAAYRECLFGRIADKEMYLSECGQIVAEEWHKSFDIRSELFCDAFVIMPNHIHAILRIENPAIIVETHGRASDDADDIETHSRASLRNDGTSDDADDIETHSRASLRGDGAFDDADDIETNSRASLHDHHDDRASVRGGRDGNGVAYREPKSISSFVAGFKSAVTARINTLRHTQGTAVWQTRFHDHVIRDYEECRRIGAYIDSNIENWEDDRYYK